MSDAYQVKVRQMEVDRVAFYDDDGDNITFEIAPTEDALVFSVNGQKRPPFKQLLWSPTRGTPGVVMPDIGKGFPIPVKVLSEVLGGLRCLARRAGIQCNIGNTVTVPGQDDVDDLFHTQTALQASTTYTDDGYGASGGGYSVWPDSSDTKHLGGYGGYSGAYSRAEVDGFQAACSTRPPPKLSKKKIYQKKRSELTTTETELAVPEVFPDGGRIRFEDDDEDPVEIYIKGGGRLAYAVGGQEIGTFGSVRYAPQMGLPAIEFPDTGKAIVLQAGDPDTLARVLGGIRGFASQEPKFDCRIPDKVMVPPEIDYALQREMADALVASAGQR
eukprot:TRINITY_DN9754_c0_g1_i1.p2 TRINITY_DN9754_c0_g1~~TRINITY_DN9754_c0_g1_i1.p2  ORF type:complete len:330 (+),score=124.97 TRINITY_DN9754_c0_g1_i1:103-1092(+)